MSTPFDRNKTKEAKLGEIIAEPGEQNQRDAVHIAVVPVIADERIAPGAHVDVIHRGVTTYASTHGVPVGIADPFLRAPIEKGQTFWLFLYQGQVTTLRHEWTHPAFPNVHEATAATGPSAREVSEAWLRKWCGENDCPHYETVLAAVLDGQRSDWDSNYIHFYGQDAHASIPSEFWDHMEVVTGKKFAQDDRATGFSCSC